MNIVFVGAWWTGMSWLAMMLFDIGYKNIICINNVQTDLTDRLQSHGLKVVIGHGIYQIDTKDFVIYSDIQSIVDGPEITQSRIYQQNPTQKHFHICLTYNQFVAEISKRFITISVAWSNGKTSTTAMLIWTLANLSPSFWLGIVWWLMPDFDYQWYAISPDVHIQSDIFHLFEHIFNQKHQLDYSLLKKYIFVIEACEYREHFLLYDTDYTLITNIQRDHVDYFQTEESYKQAFVHMMQKTRRNNILTPIAYDTLSSHAPESILSDNFPFDNRYLIGSFSFSNASLIEKILHIVEPKIQASELQNILSKFRWVSRRMEFIGTIQNNPVYSDYSHHAPAIAGNMQALKRQFPDKKVCVVFQPHQAKRVLAGRDDFANALQGNDQLIIYKLYTAREDFLELQKTSPRLNWLQSFDNLGEEFAHTLWGEYITDMTILSERINHLTENTIIVYFSAGDLDRDMRKIVEK